MDNNQAAGNPPEGAVNPNIVVTPSGGGSNKTVWIVVAVVAILIIGGIYFYMINSQKSSAPTGQISTQTTKVQENLDSDLNAINVDSGEDDFSSVDADLKNL